MARRQIGVSRRQFGVDKDRIGITGISWGGYLTCIVAGIDHELKVAVPVYGCGFLAENSAWQQSGIFDRMSPEMRARWIENFDPSRYLAGVRCPVLFVNGTNDGAYPLDSYQKSYQLVTSPRTLCVTVIRSSIVMEQMQRTNMRVATAWSIRFSDSA